jgi:hypothetical protein
MNVEVYIQVDELTSFDFVWMSSSHQVFFTIVPSTDAEWLFAYNTDTLLGR